MEIIAQRQFNILYIIFDILFLVILLGLLIFKKKYATIVVGLLAGILYMIVDYGIFHLLTGSRSISEGYSLFWVLLWMSMSYGFTNFVWIWLWIKKDKDLFNFSFLILLWWFVCPLLAKTFGKDLSLITIQRTTGSYHSYMALILFIGYLGVIIWNMFQKDKKERFPILWMLAIGILVQFGWEFGLLIGGIRSATIASWDQKLMTLLINSLLETNLGMPYIMAIYVYYNRFRNEDLTLKHEVISFKDSLSEINSRSCKNN